VLQDNDLKAYRGRKPKYLRLTKIYIHLCTDHFMKIKLSLYTVWQLWEGEWRYRSIYFNFCIRWSWVVRFTSRTFYGGKNLSYKFSLRFIGPTRFCPDLSEKKKLCFPYQSSNYHLADVPPVAQLLHPMSYPEDIYRQRNKNVCKTKIRVFLHILAIYDSGL
jgi:hypothetical protein